MKKAVIGIVVIVIAVAAGYTLKNKPAAEQNQTQENQPAQTNQDQASKNTESAVTSTSTTGGSSAVPQNENSNPVKDVMDNVDVPPATAETKTFAVTAQNFSFSPKEIRVKKGDKVKINFTNQSGAHSWVINEFNAHTDTIGSGETDSVEFTADKTGTFEYYCSVGSHRAMGMTGSLIVE